MSLDHLLQRADIWRGGEHSLRGRHHCATPAVATGCARLDAQLPGGGLPLGALTELLLDHRGIGELGLLLPALGRLSRDDRWLAWVEPPYLPYAPALAATGIRLDRLLVIHPRETGQRLWAMEQTLRSGSCGAVLGWAAHPDNRTLRRLQLAAEAGDAAGVLFRPLAAAKQASPAALRLQLAPVDGGLQVQVLKRRGGWGMQPVFVEHAHVVA
jgi:hypothetical protein